MTEKPKLDRLVSDFIQPGNTIGTIPQQEQLRVRLETQEEGGEPFFVIVTDGWSFDNIEGFTDVIERASNGVKTQEPPESEAKPS